MNRGRFSCKSRQAAFLCAVSIVSCCVCLWIYSLYNFFTVTSGGPGGTFDQELKAPADFRKKWRDRASNRSAGVAPTLLNPSRPNKDAPGRLLNTCNEISYFIQSSSDEDENGFNNFEVGGGILLRPGSPYVGGAVALEEYAFFQVCLPDYEAHHHFHDIEIVMGAEDGDPDLYISPTTVKPTMTTSTWISKHIGGESVKLSSNLPEFPPGSNTLYVGVYGGGNPVDYKSGPDSKDGKMYAHFSIEVKVLDRKNPYQNLRVRSDDAAMKAEIDHETWKSTSEDDDAYLET
jgi:hypothetical protein|eukprot:g2746.t1